MAVNENDPLNVPIDDLVRWDRRVFAPEGFAVAPPEGGGRECRDESLLAALILLASQQRSFSVRVCDITLAAYRFGGNPSTWPKRWRVILRDQLKRLNITVHRPKCRGNCAYRNEQRHRHLFFYLPPQLIGAARYLGKPNDDSGLATLDPAKKLYKTKDLRWINARLRQAQRLYNDENTSETDHEQHRQDLFTWIHAKELAKDNVGAGLGPVYIPALLLGAAAGLTKRQSFLLTSLVREETKVKKKDAEPDRCPFLPAEGTFVAFDGQNRARCRRQGEEDSYRRGTGYYLEPRLRRAGYVGWGSEPRKFWRLVRRYLRDLNTLAVDCGLVAGFRGRDGRWFTVAEALELIRRKANRLAVERSLLHVYGPADYLTRWREWLCRRAGVRKRGEVVVSTSTSQLQSRCAGLAEKSTTPPSEDALWLRDLLKKAGLSQREAAKQLGINRSILALVCTGRRKLTAELRSKITSGLAEHVGEVVTSEMTINCAGYSEKCA
jgi:hypothetical protein